jgi:hypothetical protein
MAARFTRLSYWLTADGAGTLAAMPSWLIWLLIGVAAWFVLALVLGLLLGPLLQARSMDSRLRSTAVRRSRRLAETGRRVA